MTPLSIGEVLTFQPSDYRRRTERKLQPGEKELTLRVTRLPERIDLCVAEWLPLDGIEIVNEVDGDDVSTTVHRQALHGRVPRRLNLITPHFMERDLTPYERPL